MLTERQPLTEKQSEVYDFVEMRIVVDGKPPTVREIANRFGIQSPNGVTCHLHALEKKGWLTRDPNRSCAISLVKSPWQELRTIARAVERGASPANLFAPLYRLDSIHQRARDANPESQVYQPESKREAIADAVDASCD